MAQAITIGTHGSLGVVPDWDNAPDDAIICVGDPMPEVVSVDVAGPLTLVVRFDDGVTGKVRFEASALQNMFAVLKDPQYFAQVGILNHTVSWPNEMPDLAPDAMYDEIVAHGEWVLA